ncbi:UNVERIFIED_CONTAM: Retrovirus-related Pol polyprotein from transposon TNT 1-94 [Sesamum calycinum]|uniref:Retrovirus-related Pol polyprotein from transposon TNT 1-94 n=1 Tax=Sesamum calycinum TaxID=2727403 RepID=A0AAW2IV99_9LAMI
MTHKSAPAVLVGNASTSKAKGKRADAGRGRRERERSTEPLPAPRAPLLPPMERAKGKGRLEVLGRSRKLSKDEMILRLGDRKAVVAEAVGSLNLVIVFLKKSFSLDNRRDEVLLEESSEPPQQNNTTSLEPSFPTDGVPFLCISTRESRLPERYGFVGLTSQLDNDPKTYGEAMSDIDSDKWLEAMKSKMDSIDSNQNGRENGLSQRYVEEDIFMDQSEDFTSVGEEQKDMGEASYILGIKIYRDRSRKMLGLTQSSYIEKVLKRFKMENSKRGFLPMRHGIKLSKKQSPKTYEELKRMLDISYTSVVGSIQYAVQCTRLYVAYALSITSGYQACAGRRTGCNASFQSDDDDAKSQSGFCIQAEWWCGCLEKFQAGYHIGFHHEAEYITTSEVVWMKNYIQELGVVPSIAEPVVIFCDNNRAITQAKESRSHTVPNTFLDVTICLERW